jgi:hypothetical protein
MQTSRTSLVVNDQFGILNNFFNVPPYYYRVRNCDTNMTANTPANQYQRQKLIQNTVRVYASLYTMNLGSLSAYTKPPIEPHGGVCWNQMSDRPVPSVQRTVIPTGSNTSLNRRHTSVTSSRPGCQSPGGVGCDIKHNSYDRYLNRLKGKGPLRRGDIPYGFGTPQIPFNVAYPVYGGKVMKTNIVNDCNCPIVPKPGNTETPIYNNPFFYNINNVISRFGIGDNVYAIETGIAKNVNNNIYTKAKILSINEMSGMYGIQFEDETIEYQTINMLKKYFPCDCESKCNNSDIQGSSIYGTDCVYPIIVENVYGL